MRGAVAIRNEARRQLHKKRRAVRMVTGVVRRDDEMLRQIKARPELMRNDPAEDDDSEIVIRDQDS